VNRHTLNNVVTLSPSDTQRIPIRKYTSSPCNHCTPLFSFNLGFCFFRVFVLKWIHERVHFFSVGLCCHWCVTGGYICCMGQLLWFLWWSFNEFLEFALRCICVCKCCVHCRDVCDICVLVYCCVVLRYMSYISARDVCCYCDIYVCLLELSIMK